eukprot:scaffold13206_cov23-Tisochrysis_lutea.AAC.1
MESACMGCARTQTKGSFGSTAFLGERGDVRGVGEEYACAYVGEEAFANCQLAEGSRLCCALCKASKADPTQPALHDRAQCFMQPSKDLETVTFDLVHARFSICTAHCTARDCTLYSHMHAASSTTSVTWATDSCKKF